MPPTKMCYVQRRERLAMAALAKSILMAKVIVIQKLLMSCRVEKRGGHGTGGRLIKLWVTGEKAIMEQEDIDRESFELA